MKLVIFGTGPFCVPTLSALVSSAYDVLAVVTRPITDPGKRRKTTANPVREFAVEHGLQVMEPDNCNAEDSIKTIERLSADLFFVCDYGQILSNQCLQSSRLGGINLHGSLLPSYRGAAPVNWAIYHGETETGVTVIHMTPRMDAGPSLVQASLQIEPDETADRLEGRLSELGVSAVMQAIQLLEGWDTVAPIGTPQDPSRATRAPRLRKSAGRIDWTRTARQIVNQIRAFKPWPATFCEWTHGRQPLRIIIHHADVMKIETDAPPGVVVAADKDLLAIQTGEHALSIRQIQPAGKKVMPIADFLRGHPFQVGQQMN